MKQKVSVSNLQDNNSENEERKEMRLQVYLAHAGVASRRACEEIIAAGRVAVNGTVVTVPGTKVIESDTVTVDGKPVQQEEQKRYVLLHKPAGYVCSLADEKGRKTAAELLKPHFTERLYNVGRLDMFSAGLIIFTNDGDFAAKVSHPSAEIEKEYIVETSLPIPEGLVEAFMKGIRIEGVFYKCKFAEQIGARRIRVVLIEGKNREIRRVFEHYDAAIKRLTRIRIGPIQNDGLQAGQFRELKPDEIKNILKGVSHDSRH
ncbi:MAG: rRNA pseudouridine synthase [Treponema sp.]|nr:rRNA pseudouridine synthase [Candidatus Treponema caballi]